MPPHIITKPQWVKYAEYLWHLVSHLNDVWSGRMNAESLIALKNFKSCFPDPPCFYVTKISSSSSSIIINHHQYHHHHRCHHLHHHHHFIFLSYVTDAGHLTLLNGLHLWKLFVSWQRFQGWARKVCIAIGGTVKIRSSRLCKWSI